MSNNIMSNSSIWGNTGTDDVSALTGVDRLAADKNTFLKLLVAQLTHQDPLNPAEDKEFVAQLAQFTSLEQLQEINSGVGTLNTTMTQGQMLNATSFIGKDVVASGDQVTKLNNANGDILTTNVYFTVDSDIAKGQVTILDQGGNLVYQENLGSHKAGSYSFPWSGRDLNGKEASTGVYRIIVSAQDANDKAVLVKTEFTARVVGVSNEDGAYKLRLDGGRTVALTDVSMVTNAEEVANKSEGDTSGDASGGTGGTAGEQTQPAP